MDIVYLIIFFILGTLMGSFFTVVGSRLPRREDFIKSRSHCDNCGHELSLLDMIPMISYLILHGKCRYCGTKISPRYMVVELLTMGLWLLTYYYFGHYNISICIVTFIVISCFIAIFFIDAKHYIIPDSLVLIIGGCGLVSVIMSAITETAR